MLDLWKRRWQVIVRRRFWVLESQNLVTVILDFYRYLRSIMVVIVLISVVLLGQLLREYRRILILWKEFGVTVSFGSLFFTWKNLTSCLPSSEDTSMSDGPFLPDSYYDPPSIDTAMFYYPYIPLTTSSATSWLTVTFTFTTRYEIYENATTIRGTVVRIKRITDGKLMELAEHIDLLTHIKHSNTDNKTILFRTTVEGLVYLKLKDIIR